MASGALFGTSASGPGSTHGSKHLVEIKAGRMNLKGKMVCPDKRKGLLYVYQSEDSLMHFCWKDRNTGVVEDDLIIFPDDCEYTRVAQCTTGRVYLLKFKSSNRRFFFWLQEPKTDKDDENCKKVNDLLNNPPAVGSVTGSSSSTSGNSNELSRADQDLQSLLNSMSQSQIMQLFGGMGPGLSNLLGPSAGRTGSGNSASTRSQSSRNQAVTNSSTTAAASTNQTETAEASSVAVDLAPALTNDVVSSLLDDDKAVGQLQQHLPAVVADANDDTTKSNDGKQQLRETIQSPQFQQAVSLFSNAFQYGQLGHVVAQMASESTEAVEAANKGDMKTFLQALENDSGPEKMDADGSESATPATTQTGTGVAKETTTKKDNDDESMQLD